MDWPSSTVSPSTWKSSSAWSTGIGNASWARKRTALATCFGSSIPMSSIVRTPMRLFAMPIRTLRFDRPCRLKKNLSASVSAATSLTSPPATIPRGIGSRAI